MRGLTLKLIRHHAHTHFFGLYSCDLLDKDVRILFLVESHGNDLDRSFQTQPHYASIHETPRGPQGGGRDCECFSESCICQCILATLMTSAHVLMKTRLLEVTSTFKVFAVPNIPH